MAVLWPVMSGPIVRAKTANSEVDLNEFSGLGLAESKQNGFLKRKKTRKSWAAAAAPIF